MTSSSDCESDFGNWVECSKRVGIAVVVLEAETGFGKTYVAQSVFDYLAETTKSLDGSYWKPGLAPQWPQTNKSAVEPTRKTVVPSNLRVTAWASYGLVYHLANFLRQLAYFVAN